MNEKITKMDEAVLLGNVDRARKIRLQRIRSSRTEARHMFEYAKYAERIWPELKDDELHVERREECVQSVALMDQLEAEVLAGDWPSQSTC